MNIQLRPIEEGPSGPAIFSLVFFIFSFIGLSLFFFFHQGNWSYALVTVAAGTVISILLVVLWPRPVPVIIINQEGIFDRRLGVGVIRWADIIDVHMEVGPQFLCLRLRDPEVYISRLPEPIRKKLEFHQSLGFKMLNISIKGLNMGLLPLRDLVQNQIKSEQVRDLH